MCTKVAMRAGTGALVLLLGLSVLALGAKREDPDAAGELYGDLYVIERDGNGEPVTREVTYVDPHTGNEETVECLQPVAFPSDTCLLGECELVELNAEKEGFDPEEEDACEPQAEFVGCLREVSFGRGSVARAQDFVIDSAYAEFIKTINEAIGIGFDPAGRIQLEIPAEDSEGTIVKTIDAPLENLGLYREIMTNGCLGTVTDEQMGEEGVPIMVTFALNENAIDLLCGGDYAAGCVGSRTAPLLCDYPTYGTGEWWMEPAPDADGVTPDDLLLATAFLAGATDKGDPLSFDEVINLNTYLGLNAYTFEKVKQNRILVVTYFDFGGFTYDRTSVFPGGTNWNILSYDDVANRFDAGPVDVFGGSPHGVDLDAVNLTVCRDGFPQGVCDGSPNPICGGANSFAQAAEHARKTIWFVHNWEVPEIAY